MFCACNDFISWARWARIVGPGLPHHVTARGNRREPIFFEDRDEAVYCDFLSEPMRKSRAMDENHLLAAIRYVALNQVRAQFVRRAEDWPWWGTQAHLAGEDDALAAVAGAGPVANQQGRLSGN